MQFIEDMTTALLDANRNGTSVPPPHTHGDVNAMHAYAIATAVFTARHGSLDPVAGYKISLVTPEHRTRFGTDSPTYGRFVADELLEAPATITLNSLHCPLVEPELVFVVDADLSPGASEDEVRTKCRVAAGFEIPDSRLEGWYPVPEQTVGDLIADNSFAGLVVHSRDFVAADSLDLAKVTCELTFNDDVVGRGRGADVMGNPASAVSWLSRTLASNDLVLTRGTRISSGTFAEPPVARPGTFVATYTGIGSVSATFV